MADSPRARASAHAPEHTRRGSDGLMHSWQTARPQYAHTPIASSGCLKHFILLVSHLNPPTMPRPAQRSWTVSPKSFPKKVGQTCGFATNPRRDSPPFSEMTLEKRNNHQDIVETARHSLHCKEKPTTTTYQFENVIYHSNGPRRGRVFGRGIGASIRRLPPGIG